MKRIRYAIPAFLMALAVSCGNAMNDAAKDPSLTEDNAKYLHIQKLYDDDFASKAFATATSGIQSWNTYGSSGSAAKSASLSGKPMKAVKADQNFYDKVEQRVNYILTSPVIAAVDPEDATKEGMWWVKSDIQIAEMATLFSTNTGLDALDNEINDEAIEAVVNSTNKITTFTLDLTRAVFEPLADFLGIGGGSGPDYTPYFQQICAKLNEVSLKIDSIQNQLSTLTGLAWDSAISAAEVNLKVAIYDVKGFTQDLKTKTRSERINIIRSKFIENSDYQTEMIAAYNAAIERTKLLKKAYGTTALIDKNAPFNVLESDMAFLKFMSSLRLDLLAEVTGGKDLLYKRGTYAAYDLVMVREMKDSVWVAMQNITAGSDKETKCLEAYSFLVAWEITLLAHMEAASILDAVSLVRDADASNYVSGYGTFGKLGTYGVILRRTDCTNLVPIAGMIDGTSLANLFDASDSGSLANGKYARVTVNGKNILGMGLTPVFHYYTSDYDAPPSDQVYVDPMNGTLMLPRPVMWCQFEGTSNAVPKPTIGAFTSADPIEYTTDGSFGNAAGCTLVSGNGNEHNTVTRNMRIAADSSVLTHGTMSFVIKISDKFDISSLTPYVDSNGYYHEMIPSNGIPSWAGSSSLYNKGKVTVLSSDNSFRYEIAYSDVYKGSNIFTGSLYRGGGSTPVYSGAIGATNTWLHVYIVWDNNCLSDGNRIKMYVNGELRMADTTAFTMTDMNMSYVCESYAHAQYYSGGSQALRTGGQSPSGSLTIASTSSVKIDNLKVWNHVVSEDPAWINALATQEGAVHPLYGAANNYRADTVKVSYYHNTVLKP